VKNQKKVKRNKKKNLNRNQNQKKRLKKNLNQKKRLKKNPNRNQKKYRSKKLKRINGKNSLRMKEIFKDGKRQLNLC
jgi:hypothetical protein